jgi:hypothetical protein
MSDAFINKDETYKTESIKLVLESYQIDTLGWEVKDYVVSREAIPFRRNVFLFKEVLENQDKELNTQPLSIEEIINEEAGLFENNLTTNQKSEFDIFFSTICEDFYTVQVFRWYKGKKLSFKDLPFYQGQSAIFLFKKIEKNEKPLLLDEAIIHYN